MAYTAASHTEQALTAGPGKWAAEPHRCAAAVKMQQKDVSDGCDADSTETTSDNAADAVKNDAIDNGICPLSS